MGLPLVLDPNVQRSPLMVLGPDLKRSEGQRSSLAVVSSHRPFYLTAIHRMIYIPKVRLSE